MFALSFAVFALSCAHEEEVPPARSFFYCFWTEDPGYPMDVHLLHMDANARMGQPYAGALDNSAGGCVDCCSDPNSLRGTYKFNEGSVVGYLAFSRRPFHFGEGGYEYFENDAQSCAVKIERNPANRKVTFWTSNPSYVENGNYLRVFFYWSGYMGQIRKSFQDPPTCGADSTLNGVWAVGNDFDYRVVWRNTDSLIHEGSYTVTSAECQLIEVP